MTVEQAKAHLAARSLPPAKWYPLTPEDKAAIFILQAAKHS